MIARRLAQVVACVVLAAGVAEATEPPRTPAPSEPVEHRPTERGRVIEHLFDTWRFAEAEAQLAPYLAKASGTTEAMFLEGYGRFLSGDYVGASAKLRAAAAAAPGDPKLEMYAQLATNAGKAIEGHAEARSAHFVLRHPPEDAVLAEEALEGLEAALAALGGDLGFRPTRPIHVDLYRSPSDLAAVSTLTEDEVRNTGTIALCKWGRLMATSPRALHWGYPWQDSLSHELVHYIVSALSHDRAPVWMQEGLAKFLEKRWYKPPTAELPPAMQHLLAKALASGKLIAFERMHPSMAKLPTPEDATLAFAEVATAIASLHARKGADGLRAAIAAVRDGVDARAAVAQASGGTWTEFERDWKAFMAAQKYKTFPGLDAVAPEYRKDVAVKSKRGPSEDESIQGTGAAARRLRLGNLLLLRSRGRAAALEYEKGIKDAGPLRWLFATKLGRTYLALGQPDLAIKAVAPTQSMYPELPWAHLITGRALLEKGQVGPALAELRASLATNPFDPELHCTLAEAYGRMPSLSPEDDRRRVRASRFCKELR